MLQTALNWLNGDRMLHFAFTVKIHSFSEMHPQLVFCSIAAGEQAIESWYISI